MHSLFGIGRLLINSLIEKKRSSKQIHSDLAIASSTNASVITSGILWWGETLDLSLMVNRIICVACWLD